MNPLFKIIPSLVLAKHYTLFALLLLINITAWLVLVVLFRPSSSLFLYLLSTMIGLMTMELVPIYFLYSRLSKDQAISYFAHLSEFLFTCISFLNVAIPSMWASWLLRANELCDETCPFACDPTETIYFIPLLFVVPQIAIFFYRIFLFIQLSTVISSSFVSLGNDTELQ